MKDYGKELVLDLHECYTDNFNRKGIRKYCKDLCERIKMQREKLHFWDYTGYPEEYEKAPAHLKGTSAVQFIRTSNITIHTLDDLKRIYINVFSCKQFDAQVVIDCSLVYFGGKVMSAYEIGRK